MKNDNPGFLSASYQERKRGKIHISICPWIWVLSSKVWLKWKRGQSCQSRLRSLHVWAFGAKFRQICASCETVAVCTAGARTQISIHSVKMGLEGAWILPHESLTVPGRDRLSSRPSAGRRRSASCCSLKPSWPGSDGWTRRSSGPRQTAVYQVCIHPEVIGRDKRTLLAGSHIRKWAFAEAPAELG